MELRDELQKTFGDSYTIERELGGGGMSRVFLAVEQSLGRPVVVKVLPSETAGAVSIERFKREIRLAASLQQANIVPLLSAGEAAGVPYYTMPFVKGESLRVRLATEGTLPVAECVAILRDVARALAFAHAENVVHRDIKPENILLSGGTAVVTDFGIAKAVDASSTHATTTLTQLGVALGTPAYMAPEQIVGESVDGRADIYSLGVVAYEMLTGATPFAGRSSQAMLAAHVMEVPPAIVDKCPGAPAGLLELVTRCLAKEQADRPQSAAVVLRALDSLTTPHATATRAAPTDEPRAASTIAVLPFANMSSDPDTEFLSDGISEELLNTLARLKGLRVIARASSFAFKGKSVDLREIGQRLGASLLLDGSLRRSGNRLRISAQLIDAATGVQRWSDRYDREMKDVFEIQDDITAAIRDALGTVLGVVDGAPNVQRAIDPETYELLLRGRYFMNRPPEGIAKGSALLKEAAERAPEYGPALLDLARMYTVLANFGIMDNHVARPAARDFAMRALRFDPSNGGAHTELGTTAFLYEYDFSLARQHFERGIELSPHDPWTCGSASFLYGAIGDYETAKGLTRRSVAADPVNPFAHLIDAWPYYFAREWKEVITRCDRVAELDPHYSGAYPVRAYALAHLGRFDEALRAAERTVELSGRHPYQLTALCYVLAAAGRTDEARRVLAELVALSQSATISLFPVATAQLALGDVDNFFATMERYYTSRGHWMPMLRADAVFDPAREDPRFADLLRRVGVPEWRRTT
ncbi:MAG TPA: protein kinase [Gemmatimonadaceae bacterium]|nr:protein kinase [Gemmatimonadaceae bacterium]